VPKPILTNKTIILTMKNKEAVSPVIGVVLLLAITLVLASVMFLWVSGIVLQSSSAPVGTLAVEKTGNATLVNYTITLTAFRPKTEPEDVVCCVYDENRMSMAMFSFSEPDTETNNGIVKNANWTDKDSNSRFSSYDIIQISVNRVDEELAHSFSLRYKPNNILIAEETLQ